MKPSVITMLAFYRHLGKLFYCIAGADKTVRQAEIKQLKSIVRAEWVPLENSRDEFGTDAAYQIEIVFDWLVENALDTSTVLDEFIVFRNEHPSLFTEPVNKLILKTANAIAAAFSGINVAERTFLKQLHDILSVHH